MSAKKQTFKDIRTHFLKELHSIYPDHEILFIINLIFKTRFGIKRLHLLMDSSQIIPFRNLKKIFEICDELKTGKPVQYVLGQTSFYNCTIKVNNQTLIPRPETEELVDLIIKENSGFSGRIIDIGTGSGCIAIAIKKNLQKAELTGLDISEGTLEVASHNAKLNDVNVLFLKRDILKIDTESIPSAEIIVSNPPYVLESEKHYMNKNVLDFEPPVALFVPDEDPLLFYKAIINLSQKILSPQGKIYFEINETRGREICALLESAGYSEVKIIKDINSKERIVKGVLHV